MIDFDELDPACPVCLLRVHSGCVCARSPEEYAADDAEFERAMRADLDEAERRIRERAT